jgi:hypothetical protein
MAGQRVLVPLIGVRVPIPHQNHPETQMKPSTPKILTDVKTFIVDRSKWYRGRDNSCLLKPGNKMCCLGFYAEACGIDRKLLRDVSTPGDVSLLMSGEEDSNGKRVHQKSDMVWETKLVHGKDKQNSKTCDEMMKVNDDTYTTDKVRETKLKALFKKIGIAVRFK